MPYCVRYNKSLPAHQPQQPAYTIDRFTGQQRPQRPPTCTSTKENRRLRTLWTRLSKVLFRSCDGSVSPCSISSPASRPTGKTSSNGTIGRIANRRQLTTTHRWLPGHGGADHPKHRPIHPQCPARRLPLRLHPQRLHRRRRLNLLQRTPSQARRLPQHHHKL